MTTKPMRRVRADGAATREAILEAAADEFAAKGFELASVRAICARAGVKVALANRDFLYSKLLPIPKSDIVRGKFLLILFIELISLVAGGLLLIPRFCFIQPYFEFLMGADFGTLGVALLMYGVFNLIFLPWLFAKPEKPVWSILVSCLAAAMIFGIYIGICGAIPELALLINSFAPEHIGIQLSMLGGGLILFALLTVLAYTLAKRNFLRSE